MGVGVYTLSIGAGKIAHAMKEHSGDVEWAFLGAADIECGDARADRSKLRSADSDTVTCGGCVGALAARAAIAAAADLVSVETRGVPAPDGYGYIAEYRGTCQHGVASAWYGTGGEAMDAARNHGINDGHGNPWPVNIFAEATLTVALPTVHVPGHTWRWHEPQGGQPTSTTCIQLMADGQILTPTALIIRNTDRTWRAEGWVNQMSGGIAGGFQGALTIDECATAIAAHVAPAVITLPAPVPGERRCAPVCGADGAHHPLCSEAAARICQADLRTGYCVLSHHAGDRHRDLFGYWHDYHTTRRLHEPNPENPVTGAQAHALARWLTHATTTDVYILGAMIRAMDGMKEVSAPYDGKREQVRIFDAGVGYGMLVMCQTLVASIIGTYHGTDAEIYVIDRVRQQVAGQEVSA